jgi:ABC-type transporter Mla subunit MlaD
MMDRQARVGLFAIIGLIAVFAVFYVLSDLGARTRGYKIGVRFNSAAGLHRSAYVYLSGVPIGIVDDVTLLPDYTTDVIMAINPGYGIPSNARFLIQAPLTGEPSVLIQPPRPGVTAAPTLPPEVLSLDEQPVGVAPASIGELLEQGQGEVRRFDRILAMLEKRSPRLLDELDRTLKSASELSESANQSLGLLTSHADSLVTSLQATARDAGRNVTELSGTLNATVQRNSGRIDSLLAQLNHTSRSFEVTVDALRDVATNPEVKNNLLDTTRSFAATAKTFSELANDLRQVSGNPQTQAQLRDTVARIDASSQKIDSLLGQLGGTSKVYGVDKNATPAPGGLTPVPAGFVPTSHPLNLPQASPGASQAAPGAPPASPGVPYPSSNSSNGTSSSTGTSSSPSAGNAQLAMLKARLNQFTKDLVVLQVRFSELSPQRPGSATGNTSPLLTSDQGPQTDFNLSILPRASTSLFAGVNDVGGNSTANAMLMHRQSGFRYGGGIEYSQPGILGAFGGSKLGFEARAYDLRHPTLDLYGNYFVAPKLQLFGGERDTTHRDRRSVFGFQFEL